MQPPDGSHREGFQTVTLPEAARQLGVSESTVRRMVKAGRLEADRVERSQGHLWLIRLPAPSSHGQSTRQTISTAEGANPPGPDAMMAAWSAAIMAPIMAELAASRQVIVAQAETIGQLRAELAAARAPERPQEARETAEGSDPIQEPAPPPEAPWGRRWLAAVYG